MHPQAQRVQLPQPPQLLVRPVADAPVGGRDARVKAAHHPWRRHNHDFAPPHLCCDAGADAPQRRVRLIAVLDEERRARLLAQHGDELVVQLARGEEDVCVGGHAVHEEMGQRAQVGEDLGGEEAGLGGEVLGHVAGGITVEVGLPSPVQVEELPDDPGCCVVDDSLAQGEQGNGHQNERAGRVLGCRRFGVAWFILDQILVDLLSKLRGTGDS